MESWQRAHITKNLPELASNTIFNGDIQAELRAKNVLGKADIEKLVRSRNTTFKNRLLILYSVNWHK